jgi:uncharacterized protein (DUF362 family)
LEAIHNKGLRIGSTEQVLFEFGFEDMIERRKSKIIEMALHVAEEAEHPMNQHLENKRANMQKADETIFC